MQLMSIEDLAVYLGVAKRTIYKYLADGDCPPYIKLSAKNICFDRADVDAWLESKKVYPKSEGEKTSERTPAEPNASSGLAWTPRAKAVMNAARRQASEDGFTQVGTEHVLFGILSEKECLGATILERLDVSAGKYHQRYQLPQNPPQRAAGDGIAISEDVEQVMQCAQEQANRWDHTCIGSEHLLAGILMAKRGIGYQMLIDLGVTLDQVRTETGKLIVCHMISNK
jgi:excisionase family DNA binding protein